MFVGCQCRVLYIRSTATRRYLSRRALTTRSSWSTRLCTVECKSADVLNWTWDTSDVKRTSCSPPTDAAPADGGVRSEFPTPSLRRPDLVSGSSRLTWKSPINALQVCESVRTHIQPQIKASYIQFFPISTSDGHSVDFTPRRILLKDLSHVFAINLSAIVKCILTLPISRVLLAAEKKTKVLE
jgi:hypothetical protein